MLYLKFKQPIYEYFLIYPTYSYKMQSQIFWKVLCATAEKLNLKETFFVFFKIVYFFLKNFGKASWSKFNALLTKSLISDVDHWTALVAAFVEPPEHELSLYPRVKLRLYLKWSRISWSLFCTRRRVHGHFLPTEGRTWPQVSLHQSPGSVLASQLWCSYRLVRFSWHHNCYAAIGSRASYTRSVFREP